MRGSFQVKAGEAESEITRKLEMGLNILGLQSTESLGLLLNLLGLKPPEGSLAGLDGVLIGLRTRDLLKSLLEARCRLSPVVFLVEDLHWIDSVSQDVLGNIVDGEDNQRLLVLHTRRPEYALPWRDKPNVTLLRLEPLPAGDVGRLIQLRLGVEALPEQLLRQVTDKAEGNALFAEEILSYLSERHVLRIEDGKVEFDVGAMTSALPASVQSLLTARVDQLASKDRELLQAAAVIGRRFDPQLLIAVAAHASGVEARLVAMQALDLVHPEPKSGEYTFKHALVRDALYQSLLLGPRAALHLQIAEEIERRSGNRIAEVVETLAYHYARTHRADKAFAYLAMAGAKSLSMYSFDEAGGNFDAAIALVNAQPESASDRQVAQMLSDCMLHLNASFQVRRVISTVEQFRPRLERAGDGPAPVVVQHHYVLGLFFAGRYQDAEQAQAELSAMASRIGSAQSSAYALTSGLFLSSFLSPQAVEVFEATAHRAVVAAAEVTDPYLQYMLRFAISWNWIFRGTLAKAAEAVDELLSLGRKLNDHRSIGFGMALKGMIAFSSDDFLRALEHAETGVAMARTRSDMLINQLIEIAALLSLGRPEAAAKLVTYREDCRENGWRMFLDGTDGLWGVKMAVEGKLGPAIRWLEASIERSTNDGLFGFATMQRLSLCEIYLKIISRAGRQRPSFRFLAQNLSTLVRVAFTVEARVTAQIDALQRYPWRDHGGLGAGRNEMILGLLYKAKKKRPLAVQHLTEAKRIVSQFGPSPMLTKIETALAEVA